MFLPQSVVALVMIIGATAADAQTVAVRLQEEARPIAVAGAVVRLVRGDTSSEQIVAQALTNASGSALLHASSPGTYRVRVNRIGFRALRSEPIRLEANDTYKLELRLPWAHAILPAISVVSTRECAVPKDEGTTAALLWEQVNTALTANVLSDSLAEMRLTVTKFSRDVDSHGEIGREIAGISTAVQGAPFHVPDPDSLAHRGYVFQLGRDVIFVVPDAALLLSDAFVTSHCFGVLGTATRDSSIVGLSFHPKSERRLPDVRGTLWVSRASGELRFLEYWYTGLHGALRDTALGGRVDFERVSFGAWIVRNWYVRTPLFESPTTGYRDWVVDNSAPRLIGYRDQGGRASAGWVAKLLPAVVTGTLFDSTTWSPLNGAVVRLEGEADSVVTDSTGRFGVSSDSGGWRRLLVRHPKLGLLADSSNRDLPLSLGDSLVTEIGVPSARSFANVLCGKSSGGVIVGIVWAASGRPLEGIVIEIADARRPTTWEQSVSGPHGLFVFCHVSAETTYSVRIPGAAARTPVPGSLSQQGTLFRLRPDEVRWVDLRTP